MNTGVAAAFVAVLAALLYYALQWTTLDAQLEVHVQTPAAFMYDVLSDLALEKHHPYIVKTETLEWNREENGAGHALIAVTEQIPWVGTMQFNVSYVFSRADLTIKSDVWPSSYMHIVSEWKVTDDDGHEGEACVFKEHVVATLPRILKAYTAYSMKHVHQDLMEGFKQEAELKYQLGHT